MIKYLSENITDYFYLKNIINEDEKKIYIYGLHLIISSIIGIAIMLTLGSIFNSNYYELAICNYIPK